MYNSLIVLLDYVLISKLLSTDIVYVIWN